MHPKVSVILPVFNGEKFVEQAIQSVLDQTFPDFELIVVDDGSIDGTIDIVQSFADSRIRLIRHEANRGLGASRNSALEAAKGEWVTLLDADDAWHKSRLSKLLQVIENRSNAFIADDLMICFSRKDGAFVPYTTEFTRRGLKKMPPVFPATADMLIKPGLGPIKPMFPTDVVRKYNLRYLETVTWGEDLEFEFQLFRCGLRLYLLNEPLYYYRVVPGSLSTNPNRIRDELEVYKRLLAMEGLDEPTRQAINERYRKQLVYLPFAAALKEKRWAEAVSRGIRSPKVIFWLLHRLPTWISRRWHAWRVGGAFR